MPSYESHDPKGWCGDRRRGAALGRREHHEPDVMGVAGRMTLRKVKMSACGAYDENGTYFGCGEPLYWCAYDEDDYDIDFVFRASDRASAKDHVRKTYPNARFK